MIRGQKITFIKHFFWGEGCIYLESPDWSASLDSLAIPSLHGPGQGGTSCSEPNREVGTWLELRMKSQITVFRVPKKETYQNILGEQLAWEINEGFLTEMAQLILKKKANSQLTQT